MLRWKALAGGCVGHRMENSIIYSATALRLKAESASVRGRKDTSARTQPQKKSSQTRGADIARSWLRATGWGQIAGWSGSTWALLPEVWGEPWNLHSSWARWCCSYNKRGSRAPGNFSAVSVFKQALLKLENIIRYSHEMDLIILGTKNIGIDKGMGGRIPCGPGVRTPSSQCQGPGFHPWWRTKIPQAMWCDQKINKHTHTHTRTYTHTYFPCDLRYYFSPTSMKPLKTTVAHPILFLNIHKFILLIALLGDQSSN